ncbi:MAG: alpha/beta hydrolase [Pirellulaceae bacterium]|nr:alpha/beta hydrolase [Pirellulaceae bacterium]
MIRSLLLVSLLVVCRLSQVVAEEPVSINAPKGYSSRAAVMAAVAIGSLKLVKNDEPLPEGVQEQTDIEYGNVDGHSLLLDLYRPQESSQPTPGLIFIHGGAWSGGERTVYRYYTTRFAERGFAAATITYRLSGQANFPAAVHDAKCAVRWMRAHAEKYNIDPDRIAVIGGSAGGHLAMMVGYTENGEMEGNGGHQGVSSRVGAVVNFYGPVDLTTEEGKGAGAVRDFLGGPFDEMPLQYKAASPISHLDKDDPPTLIVHGTLDQTVSIQQADLLADKLKQVSVDHSYERLEGWPHTLDAAESVNNYCQQVMLAFFQKQLKAAAE